MNILYIITGLGLGGAEIQVCDLADRAAKRGHSVKIISLLGKTDNGVSPKGELIDIQYLDLKKELLNFISTYIKLKNIILMFKPDVVHSHMYHANIMARLLRLCLKFPKLICTAHSNNEGGKLRMLIYRFTNFLSDLNTNVSQDAVGEFIRKRAVSSDQMIAVSNGIDTDLFCKNLMFRAEIKQELDIKESLYVFLAVGRLTEAKDYPNLLNAFSIVKQRCKNVLLLIVGIGELEKDLKNLSNQLGLVDTVRFLGLRRDIHKLMNIADTYVMSSSYEGFGIALAESMACENITISTDCGGTKDIVHKFGFLVPTSNSQALADKMLETMELSQEKRYILGKNAREHIKQHYSIDAVTDRWLELYSK